MIKIKKAFTLAEVLITLAIIGIVAAISIPGLIANIEDHRWAGSREKAVYNIREAVRTMSANNGGVGMLSDDGNNSNDSITFRDELAKYLSVAKICDTTGCFHTSVKDLKGESTVSVPTITPADPGEGKTVAGVPATGLVLNNGTMMSIVYNRLCTENTIAITTIYGQDHVCANIIFDTNGFAAPNQTGKDIGFATVINPTNIVVAGVIPYKGDVDETGAIAVGQYKTWYDAQKGCAAIEPIGIYHLPTKDELNSLYYNKKIINNLANDTYWAFSEYVPLAASQAWGQHIDSGIQGYDGKIPGGGRTLVRCVRR